MKGLIMKRMIFGRIYDTESAELIADSVDDNGLSEAIDLMDRWCLQPK